MKKFTLNKKERLKGHKSVQVLFEQPKVITEFPFKLFFKWNENKEVKNLFFSVSVPKRKFKKSPDRNKIKRIIREIYRTQNIILKDKVIKNGQLSMMITYIGDSIPVYIDSKEKIKILLDRLINSLKLSE
jgi:ribonuclease P protein component